MTAAHRRMRGFTILELVVASAMLALLLSLIAQTFGAVERHMRRTEHRAQAMRTLENLMEELLAEPWNRIDAERIAALPLPDDLFHRWPAAKLVGDVDASTDPVPAKRIALTLQTDPGARERPVTLTAWIFQAPEG